MRCGGDNWRPVSIYTLHVMGADGSSLRGISPFENFEWTPSVATDGRIFYARWDYIDRDAVTHQNLWSLRPDGSNPVAVWGNATPRPHCSVQAKPVPHSKT